MRVIKLALISLIIFFLIFTGFSLLIPSHIRLSKAINIMAQPDRILSLVKDTSQWKRWHPAFTRPNASTRNLIIQPLAQTDSTIIIQIGEKNKRPLVNGWQIHQFSPTDSLTLQWYMDFHLPWYPWQKFSSLFFENAYGTMMQQGLLNIKNIVENPSE